MVAAAVLALGGYVWVLRTPFARFSSPLLVNIPSGSSSWAVASRLQRAGVVRSAAALEAWTLLHPARRLRAGWYQFSAPASLSAVAGRLARGDVAYTTLTIPEGYTRYDVAAAVARAGIASAESFLAVTASGAMVRDLDPQAPNLEGYLFPATYRVPPRAGAAAVAQMMVRRFRRELRALGDPRFPPSPATAKPAAAPAGSAASDPPGGPAAPWGPTSLHEWITVASLVEKEAALPSERALVAGVFYNRLRLGLPLQSDATVAYAAQTLGQPLPGAPRPADLRLASPYNTYLRVGLPAGPIANPGAAALEAALHPRASEYLYFVGDGQKGHRFARTLAGQDRNIKAFLRDRAAAGRNH